MKIFYASSPEKCIALAIIDAYNNAIDWRIDTIEYFEDRKIVLTDIVVGYNKN